MFYRNKTNVYGAISLIVLACSGCGSDNGTNPIGAPTDAGGPNEKTDGGTDGASPVNGTPPPCGTPGSSLARNCVWTVAGDYAGTGILSVITVPTVGDGDDSTAPELAPSVDIGVVAGVVGDDPALRIFDDTLVIINRFGNDNITLVNTASRSLIAQISTGPGSNPQDAVLDEGTLYVAALAATGVLVFDLDVDEPGPHRTIDLSSLDPDDGQPDCNAITMVGEDLYVSCSILNRSFQPRGPGKVAVINTRIDPQIDIQTNARAEALTHTLPLSTVNPVGRLVATPIDGALDGDLLVATADFTGLSDNDLTIGCLERIGIASQGGSGESRQPVARGCLLENRDLGGYIGAHVYNPLNGGILHLAVIKGYGANGAISHLMSYDIREAMVFPIPAVPENQTPVDLTLCPDDALIIADAAAGGVRVYDNKTGDSADNDAGNSRPTTLAERTSIALDIGLPPVARGIVCQINVSTTTRSRPE